MTSLEDHLRERGLVHDFISTVTQYNGDLQFGRHLVGSQEYMTTGLFVCWRGKVSLRTKSLVYGPLMKKIRTPNHNKAGIAQLSRYTKGDLNLRRLDGQAYTELHRIWEKNNTPPSYVSSVSTPGQINERLRHLLLTQIIDPERPFVILDAISISNWTQGDFVRALSRFSESKGNLIGANSTRSVRLCDHRR